MCVFVFWQTITKVLLQYCALLAKSFPSYCEKEKIVSTPSPPPPPRLHLFHVLHCSLCFVVTFAPPREPLIVVIVAAVAVADVVVLGLSAAVRADEQHPADEGPAGEDV